MLREKRPRPLPSVRPHAGAQIPGLRGGEPATQPPPGRVCAHARARGRRVGGQNGRGRLECQHMGVPVVRDRCLTEEVGEGPGFPGCLLCSLPIAQRNTLSDEQRQKGKGGGTPRSGCCQRPFPPGLGCWGPSRGGEDWPTKRVSPHPPARRALGTPDKGSSPTSPPLALCICRRGPSLAVGHALDLGSGHLSPVPISWP